MTESKSLETTGLFPKAVKKSKLRLGVHQPSGEGRMCDPLLGDITLHFRSHPAWGNGPRMAF